MKDNPIEREILHSLWKIHVLHHAGEQDVVGNWLLDELREHGYSVSPGTLYPMLSRLERLGWLAPADAVATRRGRQGRPLRLTPAGREVLVEVRDRLAELHREVFGGALGGGKTVGRR